MVAVTVQLDETRRGRGGGSVTLLGSEAIRRGEKVVGGKDKFSRC